ncbi:neuraminidase-like domain-containing protein [Proteus hauseri]|uniref:Tc toxin subunit A-related protein n=1 Tax=Proteus hauseri TaxID=183417 RepID=UPI0032DA8518
MKTINTLLAKMNSNTSESITLNDLAPLSLHEIYALSEEKLSWHEAKTLYKEAQEATKINKLNEAHYLARNNPQVRNAVALGIQTQSAQSRALEDWIPTRDKNYVDSKSVASMFSPAGYLTELYREAKALHAESSNYHLDKRRPDLAQLVLSQENMDKEVSTLSISNQILTTALQNKLGSGKDLFRELATHRLTGETPYHQPYETIRQAILLQDKGFKGLMSAPDVTKTLDSALLASIQADISPELYNLLVENVEQDTDTLFKKNFGSQKSEKFNDARYLALYYNIDINDARFVLNAFNKKEKLANKEILNLNKIIRLYKATGMSLLSVISAIESKDATLNINKEVLSGIFHIQMVMKKYHITVEQAVVLNGGLISKKSLDNSPSQFDQLFNSPPLNGHTFVDDGYHLDFANASSSSDSLILNIIKRAFDINEVEFEMLWKLASADGNFYCKLNHLSLLYRASLLAKINGLSVSELALLIKILPVPFNDVIAIHDTSDKMGNLINIINNYVQFAKKEKWAISELYLMCTTAHDSEFTPEVELWFNNLRDILKNVVNDDEQQFSATASFIASEMGIGSIEKAHWILYWVNIKSGNMSFESLQKLITNNQLSVQDKANIATFYNALNKVNLLSTKVGLNEYELKFFTSEGKFIDPTATNESVRLSLIINTVKTVTEFHHFISQCGDMANEFLSGLENQSLTPEKMASILNMDEKTINLALALTPNKALNDFKNITILIQYLELAKILGISPDNFKLLVDLKYTENNDVAKNYDEWNKLSQTMQAGLDADKTAQLVQIMDEKNAAVLTHYYANQSSNPSLISRDDVYHHLLIDNQVSAEIITTPIAQAIANIQFYINNCLSGDDKEVNTNVKGRTFFEQWEMVNKRYSTWAGFSQLVYYPENYVDPTMRIGQTKMMDTLLQSISQNSINRDTVEDAFKSYLTSFEQIANLEVLSGYHDSVTLDDGITYFIGRNPADQMSYYWRSADHRKIKDGKMAANAWTEWTKIENGLNPYNGLIRPVIFNSRLYIAWIERIERAKDQTEAKIEKEIQYSLKLSHIRYDGSWSSPINFKLQDDIGEIDNINFYLSYSDENDKLMIVIYQMKKEYSKEDKNYKIYYLDKEMSFTKGTDSEIENTYINAKNEFDLLTEDNDVFIRTVNNHFIKRDDTTYTISRDPISNNTIADSNLASLSGSVINNAKISSSNDNYATCSLSASIKCEIKKTIDLDSDMNNVVDGFLNISNGERSDVYYVTYPLGKLKSFSDEHIYFEDIGRMLCIMMDIKKQIISICIINKSLDNLIDFEFSDRIKKSMSLEIFNGNTNVHSIELDISDPYNGGFYYKQSYNDFDLGGVINSNAVFFKFGAFDNDNVEFYSIYSSRGGESIKLSGWEPVYENTIENIEAINIEIKSEKGSKTYLINDWSNNANIHDGINDFNSKSDVLKLSIPVSEFNQDGKTLLTANVKVINKQSVVLAEKTFSFDVKQIIKTTNSDVIHIKNNLAGAQYLSMALKNKPVLVRLNTLFARQLVKKANIGIDTILTLDTQRLPEPALEGNTDETMDFNGANGLYFWELFYYTPMMVANVMLEGHNYDEASRWLRYVFSPNGYIENGSYTARTWNSQPLLTDKAWDKDQLDSTDPDAVAQTDPMHYKLATFMKCLDILMERGDSAYRVLERDTLNEAKMWYMQAVKLLGDETELFNSNAWSAPKLVDAATKTKQPTRAASEEREATVSPRTANSLTSLFLPQINEKLAQYYDTLNVRLFNLRHNLSIDGQPLSLAIYATPADPKALQNAAVNQAQGGSALPEAVIPTQRFPVMLNSAKSVVSQLMQFGSSLSSITERQDAEALSELLATQGSEMILQNIKYQAKSIEEFTYNEKALKAVRANTQNRFDHYSNLFDENISTSEQQAMDLYLASSVLNTASQGLNIAGAAADLVPNIYGLAVGGSRLGAIFNATSIGLQLSGSATRIAADRLSQSEFYRRRRDEWELLRDSAKAELEQIDAQIEDLNIRKEAANLQLDSFKLQQEQTQARLAFLKNKFTNKALYNWLRGKLMAIYKPFYDLAVSRCRMAEFAYQYDLDKKEAVFIRPGAWQGTHSGLMAGESLMLNLTQMENSYLEEDKRTLEVSRIVSLEEVYQGLGSNKFGFDQVAEVISGNKSKLGTTENGITLKDGQLQASIKLSDLAIGKDYPAGLGKSRRVKQISVTLPMLTGTYQNIRAVLNYGGSAVKPRGCSAIAISHGMNDSGQFQLNFSDDRYLPFEGLPVDDSSTLTLSFPDATDKQKEMLLTLSDIVLHINYTIR